jgi:hypothetical protein
LVVYNDALWVVILGLVVRPVQGWPPTGHRIDWPGEALATLSNLDPTLITFRSTVEGSDSHWMHLFEGLETLESLGGLLYLCVSVSSA